MPAPPPQRAAERYIEQDEDNIDDDDIIANHTRKAKTARQMTDIYDELYNPIIIFILFFIFQLPFYKHFLFAHLAFLFTGEGNYNVYGYLFSSLLFAAVYYAITMSLKMIGGSV
jgi:hypothetical protein